jgi:oxygen-independent coproporphyrinogen III oxidase
MTIGPAVRGDPAKVGLYIHIPFCLSRCNYCHFVALPWDAEAEERYYKALLKEISVCSHNKALNMIVDSIYFGGGTPSLMPAMHLSEILGFCRQVFDISPDCEISLEANPGTVSDAKAEAYRKMGVNRISLGAQSFADRELASIGRIHDAVDIEKSMAIYRGRGFENLNLDLMLGLPGQSTASWQRNLDLSVRLAPMHVSVYMLDLDDKQTPLYYEIEQGRVQTPDEDQVSDWYLESVDRLSKYGYEQYEISNFAQAGFCSRHNLKYWLCEPVLGFGLGSHSYDGTARYANCSRLKEYLQCIESGRSAIEWRRELDDLQKLQENLFLGLRLNRGIDLGHIRERFGGEHLSPYEKAITMLCDNGLMEVEGLRLRLTTRGRLLSNEVFQQFV